MTVTEAAPTVAQPAIADVLGITYVDPEPDPENYAAPPKSDAFYGPLGDLTRAVAPHVFWDPSAFLMQGLVAIGSIVGYAPVIISGASQMHLNNYACILGRTGEGKGQSWSYVQWMLDRIDGDFCATRMISQVGSGEGLLIKISDRVSEVKTNGDETVVVDGSPDKRLLYMEEELGGLFGKVDQVESVEKMITKAWDSRPLEQNVKRASMRCAEPHVSIIGHITPVEIAGRLDPRLVGNGFTNRWMFGQVRRVQWMLEQTQPHLIPGAMEASDRIVEAVRWSQAHATTITMTEGASEAFQKTWTIVRRNGGEQGAMAEQINRFEAHLLKLSAIFALLDKTTYIEAVHVRAARAVWAHNYRVSKTLFGAMTGDPWTDKFLESWRTMGFEDMTLTEMTQVFSGHLTKTKKDMILNRLRESGMVVVERGEGNGNGGPKPTFVKFTGKGSSAGVSGW